eukprot:g73008.t1
MYRDKGRHGFDHSQPSGKGKQKRKQYSVHYNRAKYWLVLLSIFLSLSIMIRSGIGIQIIWAVERKIVNKLMHALHGNTRTWAEQLESAISSLYEWKHELYWTINLSTQNVTSSRT